MSHQGHEGWFPECLVCGMGNLNGIVCVTPDYVDQHGLTPIVGTMAGTSRLAREDDGHWWKHCLLCDHPSLSDPGSWGSVAYCIGCWNHFTSRGLYPPASVSIGRRMSAAGWGELPHP